MNVPSLSEPPVRLKSDTPARPPTFADVAMRLAHDGPGYVLLIAVVILAIKGQAEATHVVVTGLATLLSRSWPRAVQLTAGGVGLALLAHALTSGSAIAVAASSVSWDSRGASVAPLRTSRTP